MKILFIGESWFVHMIHAKGYDTFESSKYEEGAGHLLASLRNGGIEVDYMPSHEVQVRFPKDPETLKQYDAIVLSDVGSNTFLLQNDTFYSGKVVPNALEMIRQYVADGGGFMMIGGYLSFTGIEEKANFRNTVIADILPVEMLGRDDRVETPEGVHPTTLIPDHPTVQGVSTDWPHFLGYNELIVKEGATEVAQINGHPLIVVGTYGQGKTAAFASDCAPHWGPAEFMNWKSYQQLWVNIVNYLKK